MQVNSKGYVRSWMIEVEVIVAEGVAGEDRVILSRSEVNWSTTLPASNDTSSKKVRGHLILHSTVSDKLVELWDELLKLPKRHNGAIFSPGWPTAGLVVTLFTEKEDTGVDDDLPRGRSVGEALYSRLGDPVHVPKVFVPSFIPWTNNSFQIVNKGHV